MAQCEAIDVAGDQCYREAILHAEHSMCFCHREAFLKPPEGRESVVFVNRQSDTLPPPCPADAAE